MSKTWKIVLIVIGILIALVIAVIIGVFFWYKSLQNIAIEVYGGQPGTGVMPIMGWQDDKQKMGVFLDTPSSITVLLFETPNTNPKAPVSEPDVKAALDSFGGSKAMQQSALSGVEGGKPATLTLGDETIHTLKYPDSQGRENELGVLNLGKNRLLFVATPATENGDLDAGLTGFLSKMPTISQDSHFKSMPVAK